MDLALSSTSAHFVVPSNHCTFPEVPASCGPAHKALDEPADFWA